MAARSNQVANFLRGLDVNRGDALLVMLDNVAALWETMLAAIKLGAVIIPATTLLSRDDLADRLARGGVRHVLTAAEHTAQFAGIADGLTRIAVGGAPDSWLDYAALRSRRPAFSSPTRITRADDPMLLYFTSGTTSKPKLVGHTQASYPGGLVVDDVLDRPGAGRRALQYQLAGLGQARLEQPVRTVERGCDGVRLSQRAVFRRPRRWR